MHDEAPPHFDLVMAYMSVTKIFGLVILVQYLAAHVPDLTALDFMGSNERDDRQDQTTHNTELLHWITDAVTCI